MGFLCFDLLVIIYMYVCIYVCLLLVFLQLLAFKLMVKCFPTYVLFHQIGQGTYSSVFRARDLETGKIVALKKVRFDNFEPESVRFMAREIMVLRRLDHPNVIKLEGLITSRLSCSIYLVFEYMEHDISGLLSSPDIKFSEAQVSLSFFIASCFCSRHVCILFGIQYFLFSG